jgi:putative two-component system response regulator
MNTRYKILSIEDDPFMRKVIVLTLNQQGYIMSTASNGQEGLDLCKKENFDLILLDLEMPGMNGYEFIRLFKMKEYETPVVVFSSLNDVNDAMNVINMGAWDFVEKNENGIALVIKAIKKNIELANFRKTQAKCEEHLKREVEEQTLELSRKNFELSGLTANLLNEKVKSDKMLEQFLLLLAATIESRDHYTGGHVERVGAYSRLLAEKYGMDDLRVREVFLGAIVHDIGKIGVSDTILNKTDALTEHEREIIKEHTITGYHLLMRMEQIHIPALIAYCHHERWDGRGYPSGLCGEEIPIEVRIVSIADCWDALTSERPYRKKAFEIDEALSIMKSERGKAFDPELLDVFLETEYKSIVQDYSVIETRAFG